MEDDFLKYYEQEQKKRICDGQPGGRDYGDDHKCPMVDPGPKPHVGGPILAPCHPETKAGSKRMATVTDKATCQGRRFHCHRIGFGSYR